MHTPADSALSCVAPERTSPAWHNVFKVHMKPFSAPAHRPCLNSHDLQTKLSHSVQILSSVRYSPEEHSTRVVVVTVVTVSDVVVVLTVVVVVEQVSGIPVFSTIAGL